MNIYKSPRLRTAAIPLVITIGLGLSAVAPTDSKTESSSQNSGVLTDVRLIGASKDGNTNAVNGGEQATISDPTTYRVIGHIANDQVFEIVCDSVKPNAFVVDVRGTKGSVNLSNGLVEQLSPQDLAAIHDCQ